MGGRQLREIKEQLQKVRELVLRISRLTLKLIEDQLHINLETSHHILKEDLERDVQKSLFQTASWRRCT
jgi:hypothetical protein